MRIALVLLLAITASGCFTYRDKVAYRRAELVLADRGAQGDTLAAACAEEVGNANIDTGASEVALTPADLTPEAAKANSAAIVAARETRALLWDKAKTLIGKVAESWPPLAGIVGALGAAGALFLRLRQKSKMLETVIEGVGAVANRDTKAKIRTLAADYGVLPALDKIVQRVDPSKEA
jgi:hypothetical protein